jgi:hypothetical protein
MGPMPRPISNFPLPVVIDCEKEEREEKKKNVMSTNVRTQGTVGLMDREFKLLTGFGLQD